MRIELTVDGRAVACDVSAALVRGVGRSAIAVDELILLEHLGAHGGPSGRERLLPARAAVPRALAALSTEPTDALTTPSTDPTAALVLLAVVDTGACRPATSASGWVSRAPVGWSAETGGDQASVTAWTMTPAAAAGERWSVFSVRS